MKSKKLWAGLSSVFSVFLCLSIIGTNCALVYSSTINDYLGISTSEVVSTSSTEDEDTEYYESDYGEINGDNLELLLADAYDQCTDEEEEGAVLLKNDDSALPLSSDETSVTLFGHAVVQPLYRNSSAGSSAYEDDVGIDLYEALSDAGFSINDELYDAYLNSDTSRETGAVSYGSEDTPEWSLGEEDISFYTDELCSSWEDDYNDVAIVMLAREGGEGTELYMEDEEGISQLALHQDEKDLLEMINESGKFEKIIVLINSGNAMEVDWLDEYNVDACLWIGCPGTTGFEGVANILTGDANPSGSLTATYAVDSLSAPACVNNSYSNEVWSNYEEVASELTDSEDEVSYYSVQVEGIYVGYKYYETRYEDYILEQNNADSTAGSSTDSGWEYTDEVSYPFGYGLSYTTFEQTLDSVEVTDDTVTVTVTVTNTGDVAGKSTVQVYAQTPYGEYEIENSIEKSSIQLLDFDKTETLEPGASETLTIECDKYLLASYDYLGAEGYILSEGDYYISIGDNAHDALNNVLAAKGAEGMVDVDGESTSGNSDKTYVWQEDFDDTTYKYSDETDAEVTNQFEDCDINYWTDDTVTYLSRSDWEATYPTEATEVSLTEEMIEILNGELYETAEDATSVSDYTQGDNQGIALVTMLGVDYDDDLWETFIDQLTIDEMATLIADAFGTAEIESIDKPAVSVGDGPDGIGGAVSGYDEETFGFSASTCCYTCEVVLASTFNKDLIANRGELMGEEALFLGLMEVWAPGVDLLRTPFGGRNFEYYSEDANMSYLCSIPYVEAIESNGVQAGAKHVAGNDQENNREGVCLFFNEQAFREGSLRACEGAIAEADCNSIMHGFNRLGLVGCSSSTALNTLLREEWGFEGHIETDAIAGATEGYKSHYVTMLAAGTDSFCLDFSGTSSSIITEYIESNDDGDLLQDLRRAAKNILYDVANSCVMNGYSSDSEVVSVTPWWQPTLYGAIAIFSILTLGSITLLTLSVRKNKNKKEEEETTNG